MEEKTLTPTQIYQREYRMRNKSKQKSYQKKYRVANKDRIHDNYEANKESRLEYGHNYYVLHHDYILEQQVKRNGKHRPEYLEYQRQYARNEVNKEKHKARLEVNKDKYKCDFCNFTTALKGNYTSHILTKKHIDNAKQT